MLPRRLVDVQIVVGLRLAAVETGENVDVALGLGADVQIGHGPGLLLQRHEGLHPAGRGKGLDRLSRGIEGLDAVVLGLQNQELAVRGDGHRDRPVHEAFTQALAGAQNRHRRVDLRRTLGWNSQELHLRIGPADGGHITGRVHHHRIQMRLGELPPALRRCGQVERLAIEIDAPEVIDLVDHIQIEVVARAGRAFFDRTELIVKNMRLSGHSAIDGLQARVRRGQIGNVLERIHLRVGGGGVANQRQSLAAGSPAIAEHVRMIVDGDIDQFGKLVTVGRIVQRLRRVGGRSQARRGRRRAGPVMAVRAVVGQFLVVAVERVRGQRHQLLLNDKPHGHAAIRPRTRVDPVG